MTADTPFKPLPGEIPDEIEINPKGELGGLSQAETDFVEYSFQEVFTIISNFDKDESKASGEN